MRVRTTLSTQRNPVRKLFCQECSRDPSEAFKLLARDPLRNRYTDKPGISPGIMPTGENCILLVVRQNGKEIIEKMSVNIEEKEVQ